MISVTFSVGERRLKYHNFLTTLEFHIYRSTDEKPTLLQCCDIKDVAHSRVLRISYFCRRITHILCSNQSSVFGNRNKFLIERKCL